MTTLAMIAGMLPMALNLSGTDSSFRSPMATAVIGGLITSTVLSLVVVPVVYEVVDNTEGWLSRKLRRRRPADGELAGSHCTQGDRKSVVSGKSVSVRVDLGGWRYIKKK